MTDAKAIAWFVATLLLLAAATGWAAPFVPARDAHSVGFSRDGKLVVTGISGMSDEEFPPRPHPNPRKCGVVQVYSVETRRRLARVETFGDLTDVAISNDNQLVVAARIHATTDKLELNEVRVWEISTRRTKFVFDRCHAFCLSPQGNAIAVASRGRCVVYDLSSGEKLKHFPALGGAVAVNYSPDGSQLAGIVRTSSGFAICVSEVARPTQHALSQVLDDGFYSLAFSPSGHRLASGHTGGDIVLWQADSLSQVRRFNSRGRGLQRPFFAPDGSLLGAGDQRSGDVVFWDLSSGKEVARYTFENGAFHTYRARRQDSPVAPERDPKRFVFSPDSLAFLAGPHGGIIRTVATGQDTHRFGD
jgi:WD40 repeat protein